MRGSRLSDSIKVGPFDEADATVVMKQVLAVLLYLQSKNIVNRYQIKEKLTQST